MSYLYTSETSEIFLFFYSLLERILFLEELYPCCKNLGVPQWRFSPERRYKEHHLVLNISVASKEEGLLKAFLFVSWWKTVDMERWGKNEVPRSFSGWLSDIITAGPSLLVFSLVPFPSHFLLRESCLFFSFAFSFSRRHESLFSPSYFVS